MDKETTKRIDRLQAQIDKINDTIYSQKCMETKIVMVKALQDRIKLIAKGVNHG